MSEILAEGGTKNVSRRKAFSYAGFLERVLDDVDGNKFPIGHRRRDCERVNIVALSLNAAHERGDQDAINSIRCSILKALSYMDGSIN